MLQLQIMELNERRAESARFKDNHHEYVKASQLNDFLKVTRMLSRIELGKVLGELRMML